MKLDNKQLHFFVDKIKLKSENMGKYRTQIDNLKQKLKIAIDSDQMTDLKITKYLLAGSWKKHTILRPSGENSIDIDLVLFVESKEDIKNDLNKLHDFIVDYLVKIYPQKDIFRDVDAKGNTKSITIRFSGTGLEVDIVPVVALSSPDEYVWQPQRGGGGTYITSITKQLSFSSELRKNNVSYTSIVRALKWWRNYKELKPTDYEPGLSSFAIELIVGYLDTNLGVEENVEEGLIRFFQFLTESSFPVISFEKAINEVENSGSPVYIAENTNNENNVAKKLTSSKWDEVLEEANDAFDTLNSAQSRNNNGDTISEWKQIFGPTFSVE